MPRQERRSREIVEEIRVKRRRVVQDVKDLTSVREVRRRVQRAPEPWLIGAAVAGLLSGILLVPPLLRSGRGSLNRFLSTRVRQLLMAAGVAVAGWWSGEHDDAPKAGSSPESGPPGPKSARRS